MPAISAQLVDALSSADDSVRARAAEQIYNTGLAPALIIANKWLQDSELADLLSSPSLHTTVGLAVFPAAFAKIRAAAGKPALAEVPPDQDAEEFELKLRDNIRYLVNPGSVGQPRDGDWRAAFAIYDDKQMTVTFCRVPYDVRLAQARIMQAGLPDRLATRLRDGR